MDNDTHPVVNVIALVLAAGAAVWTTWCDVIAFVGGKLPLLPWHVQGSIGFGLMWSLLIWPVTVTVAYWASMIVLVPAALILGGGSRSRSESESLPRGTLAFRTADSRRLRLLLKTSAIITGAECVGLLAIYALAIRGNFGFGPVVGWALLGLAVAWPVVLIITARAWTKWQRTAHANLGAFAVERLRFTPRWAARWWWIPVANLIVPYFAVKELSKASSPEADAHTWRRFRAMHGLGAWWAMLLLVVFFWLDSIGLGYQHDVSGEALANVLLSLCATAGALLALRLVRVVSENQAQKARALGLSYSLPEGLAVSSGAGAS